jgi:hypothetical protein
MMPLTRIYDSNGMDIKVDPLGPLTTIDFPHHEIHDGNGYVVTHVSAVLALSATATYLVVVPTAGVAPHVLIEYGSEQRSTFKFYESPDVSTVGTAMSAINRSRSSSNTASTLFYVTPTVTTVGTLLYQGYIGTAAGTAGRFAGGSVRGETEWILKKGNSYLAQIMAQSASQTVNIEFDFYEPD